MFIPLASYILSENVNVGARENLGVLIRNWTVRPPNLSKDRKYLLRTNNEIATVEKQCVTDKVKHVRLSISLLFLMTQL